MRRFDYFSGAGLGWQHRVASRVNEIVAAYGDGAEAYVESRIAQTYWGTYQRRRWCLARAILRKVRRADTRR